MTGHANPPLQKRITRLLFGGWIAATLTIVVVLAATFAAPAVYYERSGRACATCHEIWQPYTDWHSSTHRNVRCLSCHGDVFTFNAGFHLKNMSRLVTHLRSGAPEKPRLKNADVVAMTTRCQVCHQQEFAAWRSSRHSATYSEIFLNLNQNRKQQLTDDCLRCHGMHFEGGIRDLVSPIDTRGPWRLTYLDLAQQPAVPCLACHKLHQQGNPLKKSMPNEALTGPEQEITRPSLAFFDRRAFDHVSVADLPLPAAMDGSRLAGMSSDQRQALCYQCHAPIATRQVFSGDDRTPTGVHEGISCFSCHLQHGEQTRASCSSCHAQHQACRIDVERMDTTFKDKDSRHNIHNVKCIDCHEHGIPKRRRPSPTGLYRTTGQEAAVLPSE